MAPLYQSAIAVGTHFEITGPANRWDPGVIGGWQPRLYTRKPGDMGSERVRASTFAVDFRGMFLADDIWVSDRFVSARITVRGRLPQGGTELRDLWLNIAKRDRHGVHWEHWARVAFSAPCACGRCRREWLEMGWICQGSPDAADGDSAAGEAC